MVIKGDMTMTILLQVPIQTGGHRDTIIAADQNFTFFTAQFKDIFAIDGGNVFKNKMAGVLGKQSALYK